MQPFKRRSAAFTLIELLVVIAIIAILAAILFPVFAQAREKARQITCVSNLKQLALAFLQYQQDYNETSPIGFNLKGYTYGPITGPLYNTTVQPIGQATGISAQLQPYVKNWNVIDCPDDHSMSASDATNYNKVPTGMTKTAGAANSEVGMTWFQIFGTSYTFTHESESNPIAATTSTGYGTTVACTGVTPGSNSTGWGGTATGIECDAQASNEPIVYQTDAAGDYGWKAGPNTGSGAAGYQVVTQADYARPAETRIMHEQVQSWTDDPSNVGTKPVAPFHPNGAAQAYADGHVKFLISLSQYQSGCDGVDFAFDYAGSCNPAGLQRSVD